MYTAPTTVRYNAIAEDGTIKYANVVACTLQLNKMKIKVTLVHYLIKALIPCRHRIMQVRVKLVPLILLAQADISPRKHSTE